MSLQYPNHFLKQVIFQVNYNGIPSLKTYMDGDLKKVITETTTGQLIENKSQTINIGLPGQVVGAETVSQWVSIGNDLQVTIQYGFLQIVNLKYSDYTHFHSVINTIYNKLNSLYNPTPTRIALRYINHINLPQGGTFDFSGLINENLLKATNGFKDEGLTRSIGSFIMSDSIDELSTTFTYGFYNSQFPNKIAKREFLLDYDCSTSAISLPMDNNSILPLLIKLRNKVNHLFDKSIEQELKTIME